MGTPDSREFDRLKERGFGPYSLGHRRMYEKAIATMRSVGPTPARVLEAGFGIGYGLGEMDKAGILAAYVGYEPNRASFIYTKAKYQHGDNMLLLNVPFLPNLDPLFDFTVCIEVIEHVPTEDHLTFLTGLRTMAPVLCFSTPDITRQPREGVRTAGEWLDLLARAGFGYVRMDSAEWTTYYEAVR